LNLATSVSPSRRITAWDGSLSTAVMDQISVRPIPSNATASAARVEASEPDEFAVLGDLQRPQPVSLLVEQQLNAVGQRVAGFLIERLGKEPHRLRVGVESGERRAVGPQPAPHDQPVRADGVEPGGLGHRGPPSSAGRRRSRMNPPASRRQMAYLCPEQRGDGRSTVPSS
jgi:hypothetical protein